MTHTPGPWEYFNAKDQDGVETFSIRGNAEFICMIDTVAIGDGPFQAPPNAEANARLIAATPELLEACQAQEAWFKSEREGLPKSTTFHERMDLCSYCEYMTAKALAKVAGKPFDKKEEWEGVPQILIDLQTLTPHLVREQGQPAAIAKAEGTEE